MNSIGWYNVTNHPLGGDRLDWQVPRLAQHQLPAGGPNTEREIISGAIILCHYTSLNMRIGREGGSPRVRRVYSDIS